MYCLVQHLQSSNLFRMKSVQLLCVFESVENVHYLFWSWISLFGNRVDWPFFFSLFIVHNLHNRLKAQGWRLTADWRMQCMHLMQWQSNWINRFTKYPIVVVPTWLFALFYGITKHRYILLHFSHEIVLIRR